MRQHPARITGLVVLSLIIVAAMCTFAAAKVPEGYRDIKLGMDKVQVIELLKKSPMHFSYEDMGDEVGEIIRGDDLFRYATYRFDQKNILVEIGLQMREILGREKVLELFNTQHGLKVSPMQRTVEANRSIEIRENDLVMRMVPSGDQKRSAQGTR